MNRKAAVWELVSRSLEQEIPVVLLYVLESHGSSPGRQGFFMAVNANGDMEGTIGGGIMEHKWVETAKEKLAVSLNDVLVIRKQVHDKSVASDQSGMICSGEQTIFLYVLKKNDSDTINRLRESLKQNENGTLILSPAGIKFLNEAASQDFVFDMKTNEDWEYREKTGYKNQLSIIGGGHCALALSGIMSSMDYYIRIYENRAGLNTLVRNQFVHETILVNGYSELEKLVQPGDDHYVVVMTTGYRTDDTAIRALAGKHFRFLGLLGSKTKVEKMMAEYHTEGIDPQWLNTIKAPVGLMINSQTAEEIAVSIAGSIIQSSRNKQDQY